jgi:hypothetical protein
MFKVLAGAIGPVGVVGPHSSSAFGAAHEFSTVFNRLLDGDLRWFARPRDHTIFENRLHFSRPPPPTCTAARDITRFFAWPAMRRFYALERKSSDIAAHTGRQAHRLLPAGR